MKRIIRIQADRLFDDVKYDPWQTEVDKHLNNPEFSLITVSHELLATGPGKIISVPVAWFVHDDTSNLQQRMIEALVGAETK